MLATIRAASMDTPGKRADTETRAVPESRTRRQERQFQRAHTGTTATATPGPGSQAAASSQSQAQAAHYWNEYDDGSDGGGGGGNEDDDGGEYAIYIQPGTEASFPGLDHMVAVVAAPAHKLGAWLRHHRLLLPSSSPRTQQSPVLSTTVDGSTERSPLLGGGTTATTTPGTATAHHAGGAYFSLPHPATVTGRITAAPTATTSDETESVASSSAASPIHPFHPHVPYAYQHGSGATGYRTLLAAPPSAALLPSLPHQRLALQHRDTLLRRVTWAALTCSAALCVVAVVLVATGRHRLRLEVDAGATVGVVASLCCAAAGLGCMLARRQRRGGRVDPWSGAISVVAGGETAGVPGWERTATWLAFAACCAVNGAVLVLVAENSPVP